MKFPPWLKVYGDIAYRGACPPESAEQVTFFNVLRLEHPEIGRVAIHPRNEGRRTHHQAAREKAEGMTPGASDIIIPGCPALVIELKRKDHTKSAWQDEQLEYLASAQTLGATVCVALGWEAAIAAVNDWLRPHLSIPNPCRLV